MKAPGMRTGLGTVVVLANLALGAGISDAAWPSDPLANLAVCTASGIQLNPEVVSDGAGGVIVVWLDQRSDAGDVYAQRVLSTGEVDPAWPANGLAVCTANGTQSNCRLVSDDAGGAIVAWQDSRTGTYDIYAQHILQSGQLDAAWPVQGLVICAAENSQVVPDITTDRAHGAIVAWWDFRRGVEYDVYAQRLLASGSVDPQWPVDGLAVCVVAGDKRGVRLASDGAGGAIATWQDSRPVTHSDVYALHVLSNGSIDPLWPAGGSALCAAVGNQQVPVIVSDSSAGALVAWVDYRAGATADIYAAHALADGALDPTWPAGGRPICVVPGDQSNATILQTGGGDAIVAWMDSRSGTSRDIYAQRASGPTGSGWIANGALVCSATGDQLNPRLSADGTGGTILVWHDNRNSTTDIYAQHLMADGAIDLNWPVNGRAICLAPATQQFPVPLADGSGGAIVAWLDRRSGSSTADIYAQRVQSNSQLGGVVVDVIADSHSLPGLQEVHPNPWRRGPCVVTFSLAGQKAAALELWDIAGRRRLSLDLGSFGSGRHSIDLLRGRTLSSGIYFVRLREGADARVLRVALLGD